MLVCARRDSNPHALAGTGPSSQRVCRSATCAWSPAAVATLLPPPIAGVCNLHQPEMVGGGSLTFRHPGEQFVRGRLTSSSVANTSPGCLTLVGFNHICEASLHFVLGVMLHPYPDRPSWHQPWPGLHTRLGGYPSPLFPPPLLKGRIQEWLYSLSLDSLYHFTIGM